LEKVKVLFKKQPDLVFSKDAYSFNTPLHIASFYGHPDVVEFLLANKSDVNAKNRYHWRPLHSAALNGHKDVVELLLVNKAEVNVKSVRFPSGSTPLDRAVAHGHKDVVELLRQHGGEASPDAEPEIIMSTSTVFAEIGNILGVVWYWILSAIALGLVVWFARSCSSVFGGR
jgi:ankyrin repeat protein